MLFSRKSPLSFLGFIYRLFVPVGNAASGFRLFGEFGLFSLIWLSQNDEIMEVDLYYRNADM